MYALRNLRPAIRRLPSGARRYDSGSQPRQRHSRLSPFMKASSVHKQKPAKHEDDDASAASSLQQPRAWTYAFLLVVAVLLTFGWLLNAEFSSLDDPFNIWQNPRIIDPTPQSIGYYWAHTEYGLYIPLTYTVWGVLATMAKV